MSDSFKVLPAAIIATLILFLFKAVSVWTGLRAEFYAVAPATASEESATPQPAEESAQEPVLASNNQAQISSIPDSSVESSNLLTSGFMTETEIEVLQSLASRRDALNQRENEIDLREKLLIAAESRVDQKIMELKSIEEQISELLAVRDEQEEAQIMSLVKVYETMKPKDAARIFEDLDTEILLDVAGRMKEKSMAPILAAMRSDAAQELTLMLAKRRELPELPGADGNTGEADAADNS